MINDINCTDPARENEFNEWVKNVHFPDNVKTKAFKKVTRYELLQPAEGKGKYLHVFEIETDDLDAAMEEHNIDMKKRKEQPGHTTNLATGGGWGRGIYKQMFVVKQK